MKRITAIVRSIDPHYPTNRAIVLLALAVTLAGTFFRLVSGEPLIAGVQWGLAAALAVFFAWALCRELDPDHDLAAFVAAGLALVGVFVWGPGGLGILFWLLLAMRIVNRTTGLPATALDSLAVVGIGAWQTHGGWWVVGAMTVVAFLLDWWLRPVNERGWLFAVLALVAEAVALTPTEGAAGGGLAWWAGGVALAAGAALFTPVYWQAGELASVGDATGELLNPARVRAAQVVALGAAVLGALTAGAGGLAAFMPFWAAAVGAAVYWVVAQFTATGTGEKAQEGQSPRFKR